ncbi:hypothetical protein [Streptomyces sp. NPDC058614]|uniref:hypothetical protein n=1 Tax=Streptomyces sp. NPDC058614 TaxID=3346557 RepID=UPI003655AD86
MDSAVWAGIVGAAVGGGCAIVSAYLAGRQQHRSAREQWRRQVRRDAYVDFVAASMAVYEELHRLRMAMQEDNVTQGDVRLARQTLNGLLGRLRATFVVLELEAPTSLSDLASEALADVITAVNFVTNLAGDGSADEAVPLSEEFVDLAFAVGRTMARTREEARRALHHVRT